VLGTTDAVLITNLNDEQPRLIFDALSQGCLPICPDTKAYRSFGLDSRLFYKQGSSEGLSRAIEILCDPALGQKLRAHTPDIAAKFTIDEMHRQRALWSARTIGGRITSHRSLTERRRKIALHVIELTAKNIACVVYFPSEFVRSQRQRH
jgi:hypothetical protein